MKFSNNISVCGIDCSDYIACDKCSNLCKELHHVTNKVCDGCNTIHENILKNKATTLQMCPIYQCVKSNNYNHCGDCDHLPCELYFSMKDKIITDEQHKKNVAERVEMLKSIVN